MGLDVTPTFMTIMEALLSLIKSRESISRQLCIRLSTEGLYLPNKLQHLTLKDLCTIKLTEQDVILIFIATTVGFQALCLQLTPE